MELENHLGDNINIHNGKRQVRGRVNTLLWNIRLCGSSRVEREAQGCEKGTGTPAPTWISVLGGAYMVHMSTEDYMLPNLLLFSLLLHLVYDWDLLVFLLSFCICVGIGLDPASLFIQSHLVPFPTTVPIPMGPMICSIAFLSGHRGSFLPSSLAEKQDGSNPLCTHVVLKSASMV